MYVNASIWWQDSGLANYDVTLRYPGSNPVWTGAFLCGVSIFSLCLCQLCLDTLVSSKKGAKL